MGCCGNDNKAALAAAQYVQRQGGQMANLMPDMQTFDPNQGEVRMMFIGQNTGSIPYGGPGITPSGRTYRGADNIFDKYVNADPRDVAWLQGLGVWKIVPSAASREPIVPAYVPPAPAPDDVLTDELPAMSVPTKSVAATSNLFVEEDENEHQLGLPGLVPNDGEEVADELLNIGPAPISEEDALKEIAQAIVKAPPGKGRRQR